MTNISANIIANSFLKKAFEENIKITPIKLNFLVYLLSSDYLLQTNNNLINEWFIKTTTGPTLLSLEAAFGCFGDHSIIKFSRDAVGQVSIISPTEKFLDALLSNIWNKYKYLSNDKIISYIYRNNLSNKSELEEILTEQEFLNDATKRNNEESTKSHIKRKTIKY